MWETIKKWFAEEAWGFITKNFAIIILGLFFLWGLAPSIVELRTLALLGALECFAILMSWIAQWAYTNVKFTKNLAKPNLGYIFLGVHLFMGLTVFGVYFIMFIRPQ